MKQGRRPASGATFRASADAACPLRPGEPCTLCHPEAFLGPQDCPTVAIVMDDEDLRAELGRRRAAYAARRRSASGRL